MSDANVEKPAPTHPGKPASPAVPATGSEAITGKDIPGTAANAAKTPKAPAKVRRKASSKPRKVKSMNPNPPMPSPAEIAASASEPAKMPDPLPEPAPVGRPPVDGFPSWRYGPNGAARIFAHPDDVPKGWTEHPRDQQDADAEAFDL